MFWLKQLVTWEVADGSYLTQRISNAASILRVSDLLWWCHVYFVKFFYTHLYLLSVNSTLFYYDVTNEASMRAISNQIPLVIPPWALFRLHRKDHEVSIDTMNEPKFNKTVHFFKLPNFRPCWSQKAILKSSTDSVFQRSLSRYKVSRYHEHLFVWRPWLSRPCSAVSAYSDFQFTTIVVWIGCVKSVKSIGWKVNDLYSVSWNI